MIIVTILEAEATSLGDLAELNLNVSIKPAIGMILMDEESQTWEVTGTLHHANRTTGDDSATQHWTFQCRRVNTDKPIHPGQFKLIH